MRLLVCGGRDYRDQAHVFAVLDAALEAGCREIICGYDPKKRRYQGADQLAYEWAIARGVPCHTFPADWDAYSRSAGMRRNGQMAAEKPDQGVGFPRANGDWGPGTMNMLSRLRARDIFTQRLDQGKLPDFGLADRAKSPMLGGQRGDAPPHKDPNE